MFCIKCGKDAMRNGTLCEACFLTSAVLFTLAKERIVIPVCKCGSYYHRFWEGGFGDAAIKEIIIEGIVPSGKILSKNILLKNAVGGYTATITCTGRVPPAKNEKTETRTLRIVVKNITCEDCARKSGGYYEALVQARGPNADKIASSARGVSIEKVKNGYDIKFISKNVAAAVVKKLGKIFSVKRSYKLVTEKKGKKLYRSYYSVR